MNPQRPRLSEASGIVSFGAGLVLMFDQTAWAIETPLAPDQALLFGQRSVTEGWPGEISAEPPRQSLTAAAFEPHAPSPEGVGGARLGGSSGTTAGRVEPTGSGAPRVAVRAGDHGEFSRIVFEWPEAIDHHVVRRAEQVVVSFDRPGRIDLSGVTDRLGGRVAATATEDGPSTSRVTLRVAPEAAIRSFSLEGGRVIAVDVLDAPSAQALAQPEPAAPQDSIEELRRALEQRDAAIESLLARVEQLERDVALSRGELDRVIAGAAGGSGATGSMPSSEPGSRLGMPAAGTATLPPPAPQDPGAGPPSRPERQDIAQAPPPAPGQVEVDEEAVERALDFTLVEQGALLLPAGIAEVTPSFTYTRLTGDFPTVVETDGAQFVAERDVRRNEFDFFASLLVGLPFDSQLELGLPYNLVDQSVVDRIDGQEFDESSRTGHGLGDFSVGLAKTVLRERNWLPDVVLRVNWDTGTGESQDNDVVLDGGFQELTGSISLTKRQDPLAFVGGAAYQAAFEHNDIDPGDTLGFSIGTFLAASPNTSLRVVLNQSFIDEFEVGGDKISGSDQVQSILTFGASAILRRNVLVDVAVGVGLTDDSPDYSVSLSLPIRFPVPGF